MIFAIARPKSPLAALLRAAGKAARAKVRSMGLLADSVDWTQRAETCERCPMRVTKCGVSYCGKPFVQLMHRDPVKDGCGCPTRSKAKDPKEHCPITARHVGATRDGSTCDCKWCAKRST